MKIKNRTFIELLAFITVSVFLIVYFSIVVYAQTFNLDFVKYDIQDITFNLTDDEYPVFLNSSVTDYNYAWDVYSPNFSFSIDADGVFDISKANCYVMRPSGSNGIDGYYYPSDTFIIFDSNGYAKILCPLVNYNEFLEDDNNMINGSFYPEYTSWGYTSLPSQITVDDNLYACTGSLSYFKALSSNCPIYEVEDVDVFNSMDDIIGDNINPNYNGSSLELDDDLAFNPNDLYTYIRSDWSGKTITSVGVNENHLELNESEAINFNYSFSIKYKYFYRHPTYEESPWLDSRNRVYVFEGVGNYVAPLNSFNNGYLELDNSLVFSTVRGSLLEYNWDNELLNTYNNISFEEAKNKSNFSSFQTQDVELGSLGISYKDLSVELPLVSPTDFNYFDFNYNCYPTRGNKRGGLMVFDYRATDGSADYNSTMPSSSQIQTDISNYNSEHGYNYGDIGYKNPSNYLPTNVDSNGVVTGGGSSAYGGSSSASGGVAYGSNVNNSVIVNTGQDPKEVVNYIKGQLIPTGDGVGFVDNLRTATESNEFITLMSDTFSFVPQTVWNDLGFYFEIFLGILVASFVLRIILDLL